MTPGGRGGHGRRQTCHGTPGSGRRLRGGARRSLDAPHATAAVLCLVLLGPTLSPASAQGPPSSSGLGLEDVVEATLRNNPDIRLQELSRDRARGAATMAAGAFDPMLRTSVSTSRTEGAASADGTGSSRVLRNLGYDLSLSKVFRAGFSLTPRIGVVRDDPGSASPSRSTGTVGLDLRVPLLEDRFGAASTSAERAAALEREVAAGSLDHAVARAVRRAVRAYWSYRGAYVRLAVLRESEDRAERLQRETRRLVEVEERPAADLNQLRANLATKRAARIAGQQTLDAARRTLGLAMGLAPARIADLAAPATRFPEPPAGSPAGTLDVRPLVRSALQERDDLRAADLRVEAGGVRLDGARNELRSRLDLVGSVGYEDVALGGELGSLFRSLGPDDSGARISLSLEYQWPTSNSRARGRALRRGAELRQREVTMAELEREIASGVRLAASAVRRRRTALEQNGKAVSALRSAVEAERRRYQFGIATIIDLLTTADALTAARLARVSSQVRYASSLVDLRFRTGGLVASVEADGRQGGYRVPPGVLSPGGGEGGSDP